MASENHNKKPLVIERRRGKERKKTPRLTKTYEVKIIPATIGVVMETEEPPKKRVAAYCRVSTDQEAQETSLVEQVTGNAPKRVLDPTFLAEFPRAELKAKRKPYILFYYCENLPENILNQIFSYAKEHGLAVYGAGECDKRYSEVTVNLTPFEWVEMFRNAEFCYKVNDFWHPNDEGGMAWNDPEIGIEWPELNGEYKGSASAEGYTLEDGTALNLSDKDQKWLGLKDTFKF